MNEQVKRNLSRFPPDFAFRLTSAETEQMRSQIATASKRNVRHRPYAFTERGAIMAANVLNSSRAAEMSVLVVRAFVRLRRALVTNRKLAETLAELERRVGTHDRTIRGIVTAIRGLMEVKPEDPKERIGFHPRRRP